MDGSKLAIEFFFNLLTIIWMIEVPEESYHSNEMEFNRRFMNISVENGVASMEVAQRCYFKANMIFDREQEEFLEASITWSAVKIPTKRGSLAPS
jgi:hypothetical protein